MGGICDGRDLVRALRAHAASVTGVTSMPCEMTRTEDEPPLTSAATRVLLFSIAHNVLTNARRRLEAGRVSVHLDFGEEGNRPSVSGLPDDYAERGLGFSTMSRDFERPGRRRTVTRR